MCDYKLKLNTIVKFYSYSFVSGHRVISEFAESLIISWRWNRGCYFFCIFAYRHARYDQGSYFKEQVFNFYQGGDNYFFRNKTFATLLCSMFDSYKYQRRSSVGWKHGDFSLTTSDSSEFKIAKSRGCFQSTA